MKELIIKQHPTAEEAKRLAISILPAKYKSVSLVYEYTALAAWFACLLLTILYAHHTGYQDGAPLDPLGTITSLGTLFGPGIAVGLYHPIGIWTFRAERAREREIRRFCQKKFGLDIFVGDISSDEINLYERYTYAVEASERVGFVLCGIHVYRYENKVVQSPIWFESPQEYLATDITNLSKAKTELQERALTLTDKSEREHKQSLKDKKKLQEAAIRFTQSLEEVEHGPGTVRVLSKFEDDKILLGLVNTADADWLDSYSSYKPHQLHQAEDKYFELLKLVESINQHASKQIQETDTTLHALRTFS
jgi:hypothetical protein